MLARLPDNEEAARRWQHIRLMMKERGFRQNTLTNFERERAWEENRNFLYEPLEMALHDHDFIGFGPAGITRVASPDLLHGFKILNPAHSDAYIQRMKQVKNGLPYESFFQYATRDMEILYLTRHIGRGRIDQEGFARYFGRSIAQAFPFLWPALQAQGFLEKDGTLSSYGNTYADTFAGLLAWPRVIEQEIQDKVRALPNREEPIYRNYSRRYHMG